MVKTKIQPAGREPLQDRAVQTRERILTAAVHLLRRKSFQDISVAELVREAGSSVGSFYHLFGTKDALLVPLYARYDAALTAGAEVVLDPARWRGRSLADRATRFFRYAVRMYRRERGLMRMMTLHARGQVGAVTSAELERRRLFYERVTGLFLACRDEIDHPDPESAIQMGLFFVGTACRDKILFGEAPHPRSINVDDRTLARELSRAFLAYLRSPSMERHEP